MTFFLNLGRIVTALSMEYDVIPGDIEWFSLKDNVVSVFVETLALRDLSFQTREERKGGNMSP